MFVDPPDNAVGGEDDLWLASRWVAEQFALCLHKHVAVLLKLEAVHATSVRAIVQHCNKHNL